MSTALPRIVLVAQVLGSLLDDVFRTSKNGRLNTQAGNNREGECCFHALSLSASAVRRNLAELNNGKTTVGH